MDGRQFDTIARAVATTSGNRRRFIRTTLSLAASALGIVRLREPAAASQLDCMDPSTCGGGMCSTSLDVNGTCVCYDPPPSNYCLGYPCETQADCPETTICIPVGGCETPNVCVPSCPTWEGSSTCPEGQSQCAGTCIDTLSDRNNCGTCGNICGGGELPVWLRWACVDGSCDEVCAPDADYCDGVCTSFQSDRSNCGGCGNACGDGSACCGGQCVNSSSAERFCDGCGMYQALPQGCNENEVCQDGLCVSPYGPGMILYEVASWTCTPEASDMSWLDFDPMIKSGDTWFLDEFKWCAKDNGITYSLLDANGDEVASCTTQGGWCVIPVPDNTVVDIAAINLPEGVTRRNSTRVSAHAAVVFNLSDSIPEATSNVEQPEIGRLAYSIRNDGHWSIWTYDFATGENTELVNVADSDQFAPMFSHDGREIAYISDEIDLINQVWVMDTDGSNKRQIGSYDGNGNIMHLTWLPDNVGFIVTIIDTEGSQLMLLDGTTGEMSPYLTAANNATTTPDGGLAYISRQDDGLALVIGSVDNPEVSRSTPWTSTATSGFGPPGNPNLAPDGVHLAFNVGDYPQRRIQVGILGGGSVAALPTSGFDDSNPAWSPDHTFLAFVTEQDQQSNVVVARINGGDQMPPSLPIADHEKVWYLSWQSADPSTEATPAASPAASPTPD